jgi:capsular exopolysaccharide synthesis family protein
MSSTVLKKAYERWHTTGRMPPTGHLDEAEEVELGALLGIPPAAVEDYAILASRVELLLANEARRTLAIGGAGRGAGATTVAIGLAATLATAGRAAVLLVDGNLRQPALHRKFRVPRDPGLTDLVRRGLRLGEVVHATAIPQLSLVTVGTESKSPQAFFQLPPFREQLDGWSREYNYVILDSAPFGVYADPSILARAATGAVLVVEASRTVREVAAETVEELRRVGIRVVGAVLNRRRFYVPDWIYRRV